jgi:alpha-galactosidase
MHIMKIKLNVFLVVCAVIFLPLGGCEDVFDGGMNEDGNLVERAGTAQCVQVNEGGTATLSCPSGQIINSIAFASYGTPTGSCPNFSNGSCHASSSKSKVETACLNKQSCTVGANNGVFGDPCVGTYKKLAVAYSCVSTNAGQCGQGNEGSTVALSCPSGQVIKSIAFASYGTPTGSCPNFSNGSCHASSSKSKVESACLNKQSCTVGANNAVFGDPCVGVGKKLAVAYSCVSTNAAQCAEASEGGAANVSCPSGQVIGSIAFASYGTPTGSCPNFLNGSCHASSSKSKVEAACLNKQSCSVGANNDVFGDPCFSVGKKLALTYTCRDSGGPGPENGKLKVFLLAGQSNMDGVGKVDLGGNPNTDTRVPNIIAGLGSLRAMVIAEAPKYNYLVDAANPISYPDYTGDTRYPGWVTRSDVWVSYWTSRSGVEQTIESRNGALSVGFGSGNSMPEGYIGPEYGFGQIVGNAINDPVLLIKVSWGGKSLAVDFRPPSSGGTVGPYYSKMVAQMHQVLNDVRSYYPYYNGSGYDIAGFGWHQGWNDRCDAAYTAEYEYNLANLIRDLRREFRTPTMPFVIANTGMDNVNPNNGTSWALIEAQGNVSDPAKYPEFAGTVATVDTRPFDYGNNSPAPTFGYHWNFNGKSYFQIGESMGVAMMKLTIRQ